MYIVLARMVSAARIRRRRARARPVASRLRMVVVMRVELPLVPIPKSSALLTYSAWTCSRASSRTIDLPTLGHNDKTLVFGRAPFAGRLPVSFHHLTLAANLAQACLIFLNKTLLALAEWSMAISSTC